MTTTKTFVQFLPLAQYAAANGWAKIDLLERKAEKITAESPAKCFAVITFLNGSEDTVRCHRDIEPTAKLADLQIGVIADGDVCLVRQGTRNVIDTMVFA